MIIDIYSMTNMIQIDQYIDMINNNMIYNQNSIIDDINYSNDIDYINISNI